MPLGFDVAGPLTIYDKYEVRTDDSVIVDLLCANKGVQIKGILAEPIQIQVDSEWEAVSKGLGPLQTLYDAASTISQLTKGKVLWQPVMGRKIWSNTKPISFTVKMEFAATMDAKAEVYLPCVGIMSLLHPRNLSKSGEAVAAAMYAIPGPSIFATTNNANKAAGRDMAAGIMDMSGADKNEVVGTRVVKDANGKEKTQNITALDRLFESFTDENTDVVSIKLGSFLTMNMCYLTTASITFSNTFGPDGYPLHATATIKFEANDSFYVEPDGSFMMNGIKEQALDLGSMGAFFAEVASTLREGLERTYHAGYGTGTKLGEAATKGIKR